MIGEAKLDVLDRTYRVIRRIGSGGMADVYEVEHLRLGSRFAAKVLRPKDNGAIRRFMREARLLARLKSDHIVTVFDVGGEDESFAFYTMELLIGQDLRQLIASVRALSVPRAVKIISDACLGVGAVHAAGLVHRDLKPENLFVTYRDTGEEICKLLDFGVAKADEGTSTEQGTLIGTVKYMAPEQIEHAGAVSPRSDVRALGAILYECLVGRPPYAADSIERLMFKILNETPTSIRAHRAGVPAELESIVFRALERDPSKRFESAAAFADALRPFGVGPVAGSDRDFTARTISTGSAQSPRRLRADRAFRGASLTFGSGLLGAFAVLVIAGLLSTRRAGSEQAQGDITPAESATRATDDHPGPPPVAEMQEWPAPPERAVEQAEASDSRASSQKNRANASVDRSRPPRRAAPAYVKGDEAAGFRPAIPLVKLDHRNPYEP